MKHKKGSDVHGWLIVDKPEGIGSTDVVNITRRLLDAKKTGMPARLILLLLAFCRLRLVKQPSFCRL